MPGVLARFSAGLAPTLVFGFAAHVAVAVVGMLAVPFYLRLMGAEGYGLVAFYFVLQTWMQLLDFGVAQAVGRQMSHFRAGTLLGQDAVDIFGAGEAFFLLAGLIAGCGFFISTGWVARNWLGSSNLPTAQVGLALRFTGLLLVLRWLSNMYQVALVGLERQVSVNIIALVGAIARNGGAIAVLLYRPPQPAIFFGVWALITFAEAAANRVVLATVLPSIRIRWGAAWKLLSRQARFAAGLMLSSVITIAIGQADKLTFSHSLPLGDFGVFSLVVTICAGIALVVPPMVQSFQPRLTTLLAQGKRSEFVEVYRLSIALIIVVSAGLAGTIAAQPEMVVYAWTGNDQIAHRLAPTLTLYALGSGIASFLFLPYILQFAQGNIRLHVVGNIVFGAIWIPAAIWGAYTFGTIGGGVVWLLGNLLFLLLWVPVVHRRLLSSEERRGLSLDAFWRVAIVGGILMATRLVDTDGINRIASLFLLAALSTAVMAVATLTSRDLRAYFSGMVGYSGVFSR